MPTPRLLHPIPVEIRKADKKFTAAYDENLREPVGQVRRKQKPIKLRAQLKIKDTDSPSAAEGGVNEMTTGGYLLFLTADLKKAQVEIERGDRIVKLGEGDNGREVDYYITKLYWRGHYPEHGGPTMLKAFFQDRSPSRQREDQ
jgi:hypothetical protein